MCLTMVLLAPSTTMQRLYRQAHHWRTSCYEAEDLARSAIVFAPHQDDETLGCGGTIIRKRQAGAEVSVVFLTDGSGSHPQFMSADELRALRYEEALAATGLLGLSPDDVNFLMFPDGALQQHHEAAVVAVSEILRVQQPEEVFVPYYQDPPPDHLATNRAVREALARLGSQAVVYEYPVWYWWNWPHVRLAGTLRQRLSALRSSLKTRAGVGFWTELRHACYVGDVLEQKRAALAAHRSQMERLVADPRWLTLGDVANGEFLACFFQPWERFFRRPVATKTSPPAAC